MAQDLRDSTELSHLNKLQYLELVFMWVLYPGQIGICSVGYCGRRKTENPGKNRSEKVENQQQTQPTYGIALESTTGLIGGGRALSSLGHPPWPNYFLYYDQLIYT